MNFSLIKGLWRSQISPGKGWWGNGGELVFTPVRGSNWEGRRTWGCYCVYAWMPSLFRKQRWNEANFTHLNATKRLYRLHNKLTWFVVTLVWITNSVRNQQFCEGATYKLGLSQTSPSHVITQIFPWQKLHANILFFISIDAIMKEERK